MSVNNFLVVLIAVLGIASTANAASKDRELSVDGNYIDTDDRSASLLNVSLGQFVTPQFSVVTALTTQRNFGYTATTIGLGGKYFFMDGFKGDLVPFAGIGIGLRLRESSQGSTQYDFNGGLAYFLSDSTTLDAKLKVLTFTDSTPHVRLFTAGFSLRF